MPIKLGLHASAIPTPMEFLHYSAALTFLLPLILHYIFKKLKKKEPKLPPGPWRLPLIGNIHHLLRGSKIPQRKLMQLSQTYGPLMHLKLGQSHAVVVSSKSAAEAILKTHELHFADRADSVAIEIISYERKDVGLTPYGGYWRQMRRICVNELLSAKRVQSFRSVREEEAAKLIRSIRSATAADALDLTEKLSAYTSSVICRVAFGKYSDADEFLSAFDEVKKLVVAMDLADFFPSWWLVGEVTGIRRKAWGLRRRVDRVLEKIIREHKERRMTKVDDGDEREDLVDVLLRVQEQGDLEFPLADDHLKSTIQDIFAAGSDTTSILMDWAMTELMRNPRAMIKAQAEVRRVLRGKEVVTSEDIQELHYLGLVIKETLRLHPSVPLLLPRKCREACEIEGYWIPKNTTVIINAWALGRDPKYWDNPDEFRPERFETNSSMINFKGSNYEYIPFGSGRRICPGILFGSAAAELMLSQLLYYFDWKLPQGMKPEDLDMTEVAFSGWNRAEHLYVSAIPFQII